VSHERLQQLGMVKGKLFRLSEKLGDAAELGLCGIVPSLRRLLFAYVHSIEDGDDVLAGISAWLAKDVDDGRLSSLQARLLL